MEKIDKNKLASIEYTLKWKSSCAEHTDCFHAYKVNLWRDIFAERIYSELLGKKSGDTIEFQSINNDLRPPHVPSKEFEINQSQFDENIFPLQTKELHFGRFYPKGILKGVPHVFSSNREPFRCVKVNNGRIGVDFNHPLSPHDIKLDLSVQNVSSKKSEFGGECVDWMHIVSNGPGMQARWRGKPTDFLLDGAFVRENEGDDIFFYKEPRLVTHIDETALAVVRNIYGNLLQNGMKVLDLMSSWKSHIPNNIMLKSVVGLGLNKNEMENNNQLTGYIIHNLNTHPYLPFDDNHFDAVICTVSFEYMASPLEVFQDVSRILKPGGYFIVVFSNRWFPQKVVKIWTELHEFERIGFVMEFLLQSGKYSNLKTYSMRGLLRPQDDKYYTNGAMSDPVYAVWGNTIS
jgi:FKBP-type peptidyl-prolyl cis-trans isomerase 2